ncbi:MAG: DUF4340 domain-containing protein [Bryobacterales bacterium]|nr:DUF4340 domain-containing protein [Bryobacterales bacterium]
MKKNAGLLVAAALLLVVGGVIAYLMMQDREGPAATPPPETRLFPGDLKGLTAASLSRPGEEPVKLRQTAPPPAPEGGIGEWRMESPASYKVDIMVLGEWLGALRTLDAQRILDIPVQGGAAYGLEAPMLTIELTEGAKTRTLAIGAMNPEGSARYARLSGAPKLYLLAAGSVTTLNKSVGDLRQKRALDVTEFSVEKLRIETPGAVREIVRMPSRDWTFAAPPGFRADQTLMGEFVTALITAHAEAAALSQPALPEARFRSMSPVATVTASTASGDHRAEFRLDKTGVVYAMSADLGGAYPVQADIGNFLKKPLEEFRNLKLLGFGFSDVFTLRYQSNALALNLAHPNEQWERDGKPVDAAKVNKLLDELRAATATAFVDADAPGKAEITVTLETAGGTKEQIEFGVAGAERFAVRVGERGYYKCPESVLADLEKAASEVAGGGTAR